MESDKLCDVLKILEEFNFENSENVSESFKCIKCKKILKNACQVSCGCSFCLECIKNMMNEGLENCMGNSDDCAISKLSNYFTDYKTNKQILKLVLKCPEENCATKCELIDMVDHLRLCPMKAVQCIFHDFGCGQSKIEVDSIQEHYLKEQESHNKIIVDAIGSLKNEMNEQQERSTLELEMLKKKLSGKERIKLMFQYFEENEEQIISVKEIMDSMKQEMIRMDERITKYEEINQQVAELEKSLTEFRSKIKSKVEEIERLSKNPIGTFEWKVYLIPFDNRAGFTFTSPCFFGIKNPIEMRLVFIYARNHFEINFRVHNNRNKSCDIIQWPLNLDITIGILKEGMYPCWDYQCQNCSFSKPLENGFCYLKKGLKFYYKDYHGTLSRDRIGLTVQCFVNNNNLIISDVDAK